MKNDMKDSRIAKKFCVNCLDNRALYRRRRGGVRSGRGFNLCFRCHRSLANSFRMRPFVLAPAVVETVVELPLAA
jgi:hypothetical protein